MKEFDEIIELDGEDYLVVDRIIYEGKNYIYVNSLVNEDDISILEEYEKDGKKVVKSIPDEKYNLIFNVFAKNIVSDN
mgnify:CR=1 FL=1